jgi:hypothetical protein
MSGDTGGRIPSMADGMSGASIGGGISSNTTYVGDDANGEEIPRENCTNGGIEGIGEATIIES